MITVQPQLGAVEVEDLLPVLIQASGAVTRAITEITELGREFRLSLEKVSDLPGELQQKISVLIDESAYRAGKQVGRGVGTGLLLPLGIGTAMVIAGLLTYDYFQPRVEAAGRGKVPVARMIR